MTTKPNIPISNSNTHSNTHRIVANSPSPILQMYTFHQPPLLTLQDPTNTTTTTRNQLSDQLGTFHLLHPWTGQFRLP
jgi:hypothetical protein